MLSKVCSVAVVGMDARLVEVEVDVSPGGLPDFQIVGLPSRAVKEARKRVQAAVSNSAGGWPQRRIVANLAPGDLRKEGPVYDLPLAVGVLAAFEQLNPARLANFMLLGELALDGRLRPVSGVLAAATAARESKIQGMVVPLANAPEAALVPGIEVFGAETLVEAVAFLNQELSVNQVYERPEKRLAALQGPVQDLADVRGQALGRRALEIAAAGGHNLLLVGPPGCGKTMLASRLAGILPPLTVDEALETTRVWSVAGLLGGQLPMVVDRPFRAPHHHASPASIIGGGHPSPTPGEISLAHHGVLFMDELPLFSTAVLEALRQPLEEGNVTVARQGACVKFPSKFCLVAAANPCLCGKLGDPRLTCTCPAARVSSYRSRLSGPLLDRIDLHVEVALLGCDELMQIGPSEPTAPVRERVAAARRFREERESGEKETASLALAGDLEPGVRKFLRLALAQSGASARGVNRALRVARTIADLDSSSAIQEAHLAEALQFRRSVWGSDE